MTHVHSALDSRHSILSNYSARFGTDHCRAGSVKQQFTPHACNPWCLYDLEVDISETNDLASDPAYKSTVAQLAARVEAAAATGETALLIFVRV